jgi:hypothetical protein
VIQSGKESFLASLSLHLFPVVGFTNASLAYGDVMKTMVIVATCVSVIPLVLSFFMPDYDLDDKQNAVENANLAGEGLVYDARGSHDSEHGKDNDNNVL